MIAGMLKETEVHGWIISALLEEMKELRVVASFESCKIEFRDLRCVSGKRSVEEKWRA